MSSFFFLLLTIIASGGLPNGQPLGVSNPGYSHPPWEVGDSEKEVVVDDGGDDDDDDEGDADDGQRNY